MPAEAPLQVVPPTEDIDEQRSSYFELRVVFPVLPDTSKAVEMTDDELLSAATEGGTFNFLDAPEEDIYNP